MYLLLIISFVLVINANPINTNISTATPPDLRNYIDKSSNIISQVFFCDTEKISLNESKSLCIGVFADGADPYMKSFNELIKETWGTDCNSSISLFGADFCMSTMEPRCRHVNKPDNKSDCYRNIIEPLHKQIFNGNRPCHKMAFAWLIATACVTFFISPLISGCAVFYYIDMRNKQRETFEEDCYE